MRWPSGIDFFLISEGLWKKTTLSSKAFKTSAAAVPKRMSPANTA